MINPNVSPIITTWFGLLSFGTPEHNPPALEKQAQGRAGFFFEHAKGAYLAPTRESFSMKNRGKLPFLWRFTLFTVFFIIVLN